jgi:hypothetical protein
MFVGFHPRLVGTGVEALERFARHKYPQVAGACMKAATVFKRP